MKLNTDLECWLEYKNAKDDLILYKCLGCSTNYKKKFNENLKKRFANTYRFSDHDTMKVILLLWKGAYPYEHIEKSDPTSPPETKDFYCHLNMEDNTDAD